jgi:hypothetical protein
MITSTMIKTPRTRRADYLAKVSQSHRNLTIDSANTDLVERFTRGLPLTEADPATFYTAALRVTPTARRLTR